MKRMHDSVCSFDQMREESTQRCRPSNAVLDKMRLKVQDGADVTDDLKANLGMQTEMFVRKASKVVQTLHYDLDF